MERNGIDRPLRDYHLRSSSRRRNSPTRRNDYAESLTNGWQPNSGRSTPSAAVRRALQVLDESYRHQDENLKRVNGVRFPTFRRGRSNSPAKSRTPSPVRKFLRDSSSPIPPSTPPRILEIERDNLQDALGDSESRRNVLLRKLAETQRTMEIQNDNVQKGETELRETKAAAKLLHQLQDELETKVQYLEKERKSQLNRQLQDAEEKETLRREADTFHHEMKRLQCQMELMEAEREERQREINRIREEIRDVQDNNRKVLEKKSVLSDEVAALKEHLAVAKQRAEMLEKEKSNAQNDARNLQESQQAIINRNTELSNRLNLSEGDAVQLRNKLDETEIAFQTCRHDNETYKEKCSKQGYKLAELQTTHKDVQNDLDRSNRYVSELERTLQSLKEINCQLKENKVTLEDNLTTLHADLAKTRLDLSRTNEERTRFSEEVEIVKRGQRDLSSTLAETRHQLASKEEEFSQLQASKKIDSKKIGVLETQKNQGERERDELASRLVSLQEAHDSLQMKSDQENLKNAQQLRELKVENGRLDAKYKDAETRLERLNHELTATLEHDQSQLDHWRETCTKLTSLIEERDRAQRESAARLQIAEEAAEKAESRSNALEKQLPVLQDLEHKLTELRGENKRMTQECKENQQMIAVLEMERDVLAKSPNKSASNDGLETEMKKLQSDLKIAVDRLTGVDSTNIKTVDNKDEEERRRKFEILETDLNRAQESNSLLADQLSQVKKEAETLHNLMEARTDTHEREIRKTERERERLDSRIRSLEEEARVLRSSLTSSARSPTQYTDAGELRNLRVEVSRLKRELDEKEQNYLVTKGQLVVAQNARKTAEDRANLAIQRSPSPTRILPDLSFEAENAKRELETKKARLEAVEAECAILRSRMEEISEVRTKQENLIKNLRRQLKASNEQLLKKTNDGDKSDDSERSALIELASTRRDLQRAFEDIASRDHQLAELRRSLVSAQKQEQKAKQQRDELKGKTIIMESITDSSSELRKEMDSLRIEKLDLEKQLNAFTKSKPSQTPRTSMNLSEDFDKEMEKQYKVVCDRNKWLENRINSLLREIDLLRDQNSLLLQEKSAAERQSEAMEGELKSVTISSKSSRQQSALEQIHLQNSNAEKMQQIMEMQRDLREKNQLIQAMSRQLENAQKKTDKKKISSFMKKLRKSSESGGVALSPERGPLVGFGTGANHGGSETFSLLPSAFSNQNIPDVGYSSTLSLPGKGPKEKQNNNRSRSRSTPGDISKMFQATQQDFEESKPRSQSYHHFNEETPELPETMKGLSPSPTLTTGRGSARHGDNFMDSVHDYLSDGEQQGSPARRSPEAVQTLPEPPRKKAPRTRHKSDSSSDEEIRSEESHFRRSLVDTSEQFGRGTSDRKRSYSSDRPKRSSKSRDRRAVMSADEFDDVQVENDFRAQAISPSKQSRRSLSDYMPENAAPRPLPIPILPTPASSPSVLSPTSARNREIHICVTGPGGNGDEHQLPVSVRSRTSPLPSPTFTSGTPTKSKSSKISARDLM